MKPAVLCYNLAGTKKGKQIAMIFGFLGYKVRHVEKEEYLRPVGVLAGIPGAGGETCGSTGKEDGAGNAGGSGESGRSADGGGCIYDGEGFLEEMLVMNPASEEMLDKALFLMKKERAQVALKAVVTENNQRWSSLALYEEIRKEHAYMSGQERKQEK